MIEQEELVLSAKRYALRWLNSLGDPLPEDYITDVGVMYDSRGDDRLYDTDRMMLLSIGTDDDGGDAMMFIHFDLNGGQITYAAWYFDGDWGEMTGVNRNV